MRGTWVKSAGPALIAASIAVALGVGAWRFPQALDPSGGQRNRIVLNALVDHGVGNVSNDWFRVSQVATVASTAAGLSIMDPSRRQEIDVASGSLPVLPDGCYNLAIRAAVARPGARGAVFDENVRTRLARFSFPPSPGGNVSVRFLSRGRRRLTVVIYGSHRSSVVVRRTVLSRLDVRDCPS